LPQFVLHGEKLHGGFALIRTRTPKRWLLIKRRDEHVDASWDVESPEKDRSALSGRTLQEIAQGRPSRRGKR
jgi:bifunctional non-homologous end joining protein LigD